MWPDGEVKLLSDQVLDSADVAEACGGHVNLEPRFTEWVILFRHTEIVLPMSWEGGTV